MCGRYSHLFTWKQLHLLMELMSWPDLDLPVRYNLAPTQMAPVVRGRGQAEGGGREGALLRWGLIPSWAEDESIGGRMINARAESADGKPAFRTALRCRRCIVPASGFYEWSPIRGSTRKQAYYIRPGGPGLAECFAFAGLWERWTPKQVGGAPVESFTILTTEANETIRPLHDRMPVILPPEAWDRWLDPASDDLASLRGLLVPAPPEAVQLHPVGPRVNSPRNDDPQCMESIAVPPLTEQQGGLWPEEA
jgi:putative SOS response-associated peptidase YedK